jgi:hypothetical protein
MRKLVTGFSVAILALVGFSMAGCSAQTGTQAGTGAADNVKYDYPGGHGRHRDRNRPSPPSGDGDPNMSHFGW